MDTEITLAGKTFISHDNFPLPGSEEERILFNTIQDVATPEQMQMIKQVHQEEKFCENDIDPFWL